MGGAHQVVPTNGQAPDGHCRDLRVILCPPDWPQVPRLSSFWVCEGVFGELSSGMGGLSNTGAPPVQEGLPRVGGAPAPLGGWASPWQVPPQGGWGSSIR